LDSFASWGAVPWATLPAEAMAVQALQTWRIASAGYATAPTDDPANTLYTPRIYGDIEVSQSGIDAFGIGGRVAMGIADVALADADLAALGPIAFGTADGRPATVRVLPVTSPQASNFGTNLGGARIAFSGVVQRVEHASGSRAKLTLTDASERLNVKLQPTLFGGSGGIEGPSTLGGRPKPVALGENTNVTPAFVGNVDLGDGALPTYIVHSAAVEAIGAVRIRGVAQTLVGVAPTVGQARVWLSQAAFQLGSSPDGIVTADVEGDNTGGYVSSTAGILRRFLQSFGPRLATARLNVPAFDQAETDLPGDIGFYQGTEQTTAAAAADRILAGSGAILCGGRDGTLRLVDPLAIGPAQFVLPPALILALEPVDMIPALRPLPWAVGMDWAPNSTPMTDFSGSVSDADRARVAAAARGPVRAESPTINQRVAQARELRLPGLYANEAEALVRGTQWRDLLDSQPRLFRLTTDRYLGEIEIGDLGAIAYPQYGLDGGIGVVVLGWRESLAGRRIELTLCTRTGITLPATADPDTFFLLDTDGLA
jgi:hypothetical protein